MVLGNLPGDKRFIQPSKEAFIFANLGTSSAIVLVLEVLTDKQGRTHLKVNSALVFIHFLHACLEMLPALKYRMLILTGAYLKKVEVIDLLKGESTIVYQIPHSLDLRWTRLFNSLKVPLAKLLMDFPGLLLKLLFFDTETSESLLLECVVLISFVELFRRLPMSADMA